MSDGPDPFLASLINEAAPEDRRRLAHAFGEADLVARHLPAYAIPRALRACWLVFCALEAQIHGDPWARVLDDAARQALLDAGATMEPLIAVAPADARELDER